MPRAAFVSSSVRRSRDRLAADKRVIAHGETHVFREAVFQDIRLIVGFAPFPSTSATTVRRDPGN